MAKRRIVLLLLSLLLSATANAFPLSYNESVDGDLDGGNLLTLGVGTNSISGTICNGYEGTNCEFDFDTFLFLLPPDSALTQISLAFTLDNRGAVFPAAVYAIFPFTVEEGVSFIDEPSPALLFTSFLPMMSVDPVRFSNTTLWCGCYPGDNWFASYELRMEVAPVNVPAPGSFALLLLAGAALSRHRHRAG